MKYGLFRCAATLTAALICISSALTPSALNAGADYAEPVVIDGFEYECWTASGGDEATLTPDDKGGFSAEWKSAAGCFFSKGLVQPEAAEDGYSVSYDVSLDIDADSAGEDECVYVGAYGYFSEPIATYYVTDSYTSGYSAIYQGDRKEKIGEYTSNGNTYDIYYEKVIQSSIGGDFFEMDYYFCVRRDGGIEGRDEHLEGCIDLKDSFDAIEGLGHKLGRLERASVNIGGCKCTGFARLNKGDITARRSIVGDLNCDGRIDAFDLVLFRKMLVSSDRSEDARRLADFDGDGQMKVNDLVLVAGYVLGKKQAE